MNTELVALLTKEIRMAVDWARSEHGLTLTCTLKDAYENTNYVLVEFRIADQFGANHIPVSRLYGWYAEVWPVLGMGVAAVRDDFRAYIKGIVKATQRAIARGTR